MARWDVADASKWSFRADAQVRAGASSRGHSPHPGRRVVECRVANAGHKWLNRRVTPLMDRKRAQQSSPIQGITRRELLKGAFGLGAVAALSSCATGGISGNGARFGNARPELVRRENEKPGTRDWMLQKTAIDPATKYRCPRIEGYCSRASVRAGESISFQVSANPASAFTIDLYRTGYYGGA